MRKLIGKVDKTTSEIVSTDSRGKKRQPCEECRKTKRRSVPITTAKRRFHGATYLLDEISNKTKVAEDLKRCFPDTYKQILSFAYYMILEDCSPLSRFEKWNYLHKHPYESHITSQRGSELFAGITEEGKNKFFTLQCRRRTENEYWA